MTISQTVADEDQIWVARFQRLGLSQVAPALLEVVRPFGAVGSSLLAFASPVLTTFFDRAVLDQFAGLLSDPARLENVRRSLLDKAEH